MFNLSFQADFGWFWFWQKSTVGKVKKVIEVPRVIEITRVIKATEVTKTTGVAMRVIESILDGYLPLISPFERPWYLTS